MLQSVMRTGVPVIYALLIHLGIGNLGIGDQATTDIATVILAVALYVVLRAVEALEPKLGVLLGWIGEPSYGEPVKGEVVSSRAELEDALDALRDDIGSIVEAKVTAALARPGRKTAAKKTPKAAS